MPIITDMAAKGKKLLSRVPEGTLVVLMVILASSGSFGLGMLAAREQEEGDLHIGQIPMTAELPAVAEEALAQAPAPDPIRAGGQYVASKNGTRYYLPWCGGVKNIKEENKVWFTSKAEAEAKGYTPAANCKGI